MQLRLFHIERGQRAPKLITEFSAYAGIEPEEAWRQAILEAGVNRFRMIPLEDCKLFEVASDSEMREIPQPPGMKA
jgi:hypothetical protein